MAPEPCSGAALSLLSCLRALADATAPQRLSFRGEHGLTLDADGAVIAARQLHEGFGGLVVVAVNGARAAPPANELLDAAARSGDPYTVDFAQLWTDYKHAAPWVVQGDQGWPGGKCGVYSIGAEGWSGTSRCCNCSGLVTLALRSVSQAIFQAVLQYNEALRPAGGSAERVFCCGSIAYLREWPVPCSRWMPRLPRAVIYQHLAQQLLERDTNEELFAVHPHCRGHLEFLRSHLRAERLGPGAPPAGLRPGDLVVAPPGRGHTGHMYALDRRTPAPQPKEGAAGVGGVAGGGAAGTGGGDAWLLIEASYEAVAAPGGCGSLPQLVGVRRNAQSDLLEYWNPRRMPVFVLRLL